MSDFGHTMFGMGLDVTHVAGAVAALIAMWFMFLRKTDKVLPQITIELKGHEKKDVIDAKVVPDMPFVIPSEPGRMQCYDPCTAQHLGSVELMSKARVDEIVAKAHVAQKQWAKSTFSERRSVLNAILDYYIRHTDDVVRVSVRDSGKTRLGAVLGEITPTLEKLRWTISAGEDILKTEYRGNHGLLTLHKSARVEWHPVGVLGVLAPFNYPCHNILNHVISGLMAGDGVVTKVSEHTSWSADFYLRPIHAALKSAGYSPDLVSVVTGLGETGAALVSSKVNKVIFTGSDRVGKMVMKGASENLTPVVLELGGKDPFIVCKDVDLDWITPTALRGVFQNCGQNCIGIERIFVEEPLFDQFVKRMEAEIMRIRQGVPLANEKELDLGASTMPSQIPHIQRLIDDAVAKGAKLVCGGKRNKALLPGNFYEPTLITGITKDMLIAEEEVFGPVMAVSKWSSEDDLMNKVNDCPYGLGSSVFSADTKRAERLMERVSAGMGNINDFGINYLCQSLPFGGVKASGFGRFAGKEGLQACCYPKSITTDAFPGAKTSIPKPWCYPTADCGSHIAADLLKMAYAPAMGARAAALVGFLKGLATAKTTA
eukprot:TRINITY_DN27101_c0_g1_i1.p1 TRINITY_DN27101_c0_g1~~TRINITY_DN27101_c0_g1_i1.p1  ORF type:complete len:600 (+),score=252.24 TRINITY_DN27101_c0_g1_i1:49-1848(+)